MIPYLNISNFKIPAYGFMIIIGCVVAILVALIRSKKCGMEKLDTFAAFLFAGVGAFFGGRLFFVIQGIPDFIIQNQTMGISFFKYFANAGLVYYGAMIGVLLFLILYAKIFKFSFWKVSDTLLPSLPLAQAFGRVGCFFVGCCYGIPFENGFLMNESLIAPHDVALLPIQLIESLCVLVLFVIMVIYGRKPRKQGNLLGMYFLGYGIIRFIMEFFRYDAVRGYVGILSVSQWISLMIIFLGIFFIFLYKETTGITSSNKI